MQRKTGYRLLSRERIPIWEGLLGWMLALQFILPASLLRIDWVHLMILFAPLVVVPLALQLSGSWMSFLKPMRWLFFPAALLLGVPYCVPDIPWISFLSIPWFALTVTVALQALRHFFRTPTSGRSFSQFATLVGFLYLPVGAAWALADRLGIHPFGFQDPIVLLTAAHFHYAGFVLPIVAGFLLSQKNTRLFRSITWGILTGIPLVALGILITHWGGPVWVEGIFAVFMGLSGMGLALWQISYSVGKSTALRWLPLIGSVLLLSGMMLAISYGLRFIWPGLSISYMYGVHGTINVVACSLLVLQPKATEGL